MIAQRIAVTRTLRYCIEQDRRRDAGNAHPAPSFQQSPTVFSNTSALLTSLTTCPATHAAAMRDVGPHVAEQRLDPRIEGVVGADHDGKFHRAVPLPGSGRPVHRRTQCLSTKGARQRRARSQTAVCSNPRLPTAAATRWRAPAGRGRPVRPAGRRAATRTQCQLAPPIP